MATGEGNRHRMGPRDETAILLDYMFGLPITEIAKRHGFHRASIFRLLARHEIEPSRDGNRRKPKEAGRGARPTLPAA